MATQFAPVRSISLYEQDVHAWSIAQRAAIEGRRYDQLDWDQLAETLRDFQIGLEEEIDNRLVILIEHLIKLSVSVDPNPRRIWWLSVREQRREIERKLRKSPSLRPQFTQMVEDTWETGAIKAQRGLLDHEAGAVPKVAAWLTPEQAMTITDDAELRALAPRPQATQP